MTPNKKVAFLVLSCDKYADLWPLFIQQFKKNWPDCPYDKYISTNYLNVESDHFKDIKIGKDKSWSDGVIKALNKIKNNYDYALITLEDLLLMENVNQKRLDNMINLFFAADGNYLKLIRKPRPTNRINTFFGEIKPGSLYRPTCVYALWKVDVLLDLLHETESAWEFERYASVRSDTYDGFYVVYNDFFKVINTVIKGKWVPKEKRKLEKTGFKIENTRQILSTFEAVKSRIKSFIFYFFTSIFPWKYRRQLVFKIKRL